MRAADLCAGHARRFALTAAATLCASLAAAAPGAPAPTTGSTSPASIPAPAAVYLEDMTWTELRDAVRAGHTTALIPVGGTEQSGPALALGKHNARVRLLAGRIAAELGNAVVAPVLAYVPEGAVSPPTSHMRFSGTISVPDDIFIGTLVAAARSLRAHGFRNIFLLGDHGGYQADLQRAAQRLEREFAGSGVHVFALAEYYRAATEGFAQILRERGYRDNEIGTHAALLDTALQLALVPDMVRTQALEGSAVRLDESVGVYGGDPRRATAELGRLGVDCIVTQSVAAIGRHIGAARGAVH